MRKKPSKPRRSVLRLRDLDHSKATVLNSLGSAASRRAYEFAMDEFIAWYCSEPRLAFGRIVVTRFRMSLEGRGLASSSINQRLAAVRRLAYEAADCGLLSPELAAGIRRVKGAKQLGHRSGNWLTLEQCTTVLSGITGNDLRAKRDRAMIAVLIGCGLRRAELAALEVDHVQTRQGHWAIVDLVGKGGHIRTVPMPQSVKHAIDSWTSAAGITNGRVFRAVSRVGTVWGTGISENVVWHVVRNPMNENDWDESSEESELQKRYDLSDTDRVIVAAARVLLNKIAQAPFTRPAQLVSVAKALHVISQFPRLTQSEVNLRIGLNGPRRWFGEHEIWHWWEVEIEGECIRINSGGHFYWPATGGDSFTCMQWSAEPGVEADYSDYLNQLQIVDDAQPFPREIAALELGKEAFALEVEDEDNPLLEEMDAGEDDGSESVLSDGDSVLRPTLLPGGLNAQRSPVSSLPLTQDTTYRPEPSAGDYLLWVRCTNPLCNPPEFAIADFWEFREGDRLLITNREEDYPAPVEQMLEGGPSLWKVIPGDCLVWLGWRLHSEERKPTLLALVNCHDEGYVYGEPASPTVESVMSFGASTSKVTSEIRSLWMAGLDAAAALGSPRNWKPPE